MCAVRGSGALRSTGTFLGMDLAMAAIDVHSYYVRQQEGLWMAMVEVHEVKMI